MESANHSAKSTTHEPNRELSLNGWRVDLLPRGPYEAHYTTDQPIIGFSFDTQSGTHSFASDIRTPFRTKPNGLAFVPKGCDVYSKSCTGGEYLRILPPEEKCDSLMMQQQFSDSIDKSSSLIAHRLRQIIISNSKVDSLECEQLLLTLYISISSILCLRSNSEATNWLTNKRMERVDELIDSLLDTRLSIKEMASEFGVSDAYFSRQFNKAVGKSPHQYIVHKRIIRVRELMLNTNHDLSTIALEAGFSSHSHMSSSFYKGLGITPSDLRAQM